MESETTCDCCEEVFREEELIWLNTDFLPMANEDVPDWVFKRFEAVCPFCYKEMLKCKTEEEYEQRRIENEI